MGFRWNSFGWINLGIDLLAFGLGLGLALYALRRWDAREDGFSFQSFKLCVRALVLAGCGWLPAVGLIGGIVGFALAARVAWTSATVTAPILCVLLARRRKARWLAAGALALLAAKYYGEVWEPNNLEVERVELRLPGLARPVRVVHLSDLQTDEIGPLQRRVQEEANAFAPELVLFTGDLINDPALAPAAAEWLAGFTAPGGKFFVTGDVDSGYDLEGTLARGGFVNLDGKSRTAAGLGLLGVEIGGWFEPGLMPRLLSETKPPRVLLSHRPDAALSVDTVDLILAGHTHGGQVCLPLLGPIVTLTRVARKIAAGGLHRLGKVQILVSRGLGWEGHLAPRVRAFCRPHLLLVELLPEPS